MEAVPLPEYTAEEIEFARSLSSTLTEDQKRNTLLGLGLDANTADFLLSQPIHRGIGYWGKGWTIPASTDVGDVSHIVPTAQINTATYPVGIGSHTWQATASSGSSLGMKGMLYAAQVLAGATWDLLEQPVWVEKAREEFHRTVGGEAYISALDLLQGF